MLTGENSILKQASNAKKQTEIANEKERIELAVVSATLNSPNYKLATEKLEEELQKEFKDEFGTLYGENGWTYIGKKRVFHIDNNGNVSVGKQILNYKIYGNNSSMLPDEYQQVEYIESTGTQFFVINLLSTTNLGFDINMLVKENTGANVFGGFVENGNTFCYMGTRNNKISYFPNSKCINYCSTQYNTIHNYKFQKDNNLSLYYYDDILLGTTDLINNSNCKIAVFSFIDSNKVVRTSSAETFKGRIYKFNLFNNTEMICNLIPCIKAENHTIGMYDRITNKFYSSEGRNQFLNGKISGVGNPNNDDKNELPLKITTPTGEVACTIILNAPLRKVGNTADYIDLKNKKVVRYISENGEILDNSSEESFEFNNLPDIKDILSIEVLTDIQPSKIEACE